MDDTVAILLHLGKEALMAKIDLKSAFGMIPVHCADWDLLGTHWWGKYYVDTCLPFGLHLAPFLFNEYTTAIEWIMTHNYQLHHLIHYLDKAFLIAPPQSFCSQRDLDTFLLTLVKCGVIRSRKCLLDQSQPITYTILRHLIRHLKSDQHLWKPDRVMLSAAFCLAFHGLLWVSEYTAQPDKAFMPQPHATPSDIQWHSQDFTLFLKRFKTDQQGKGTMVNFCKLTKLTCPYHSMATKTPYTTPLFCFSNAFPFTRLRLLNHLHRQLQQADYHPHRYNTHSFKIGGTTSAAGAGTSQVTIQHLGR